VPAGRFLPIVMLAAVAAGCTDRFAGTETGWCKQKWLPLSGRVVDEADLLPAKEEAELNASLVALETQTRHQFVVATAKSLQGRDVADYTLCLARHWGIGRKGVDDGVVMLVAPNERKARIEVGIGLEQALRDDEAAGIMNAIMVPRFAKGDFSGGIRDGAAAIAEELR
jgi:uncharacterized protein